MKLPPFQEYLSTITVEQISTIGDRIDSRIHPATGSSSPCSEDIMVAYATAIAIEFLSYYHAWLARYLDPMGPPPAS